MRPWVDHLISNAAACEDFLAFAKEAGETLAKTLTQQVLDGRFNEAQATAGEIALYENLSKKIRNELRERQAVIQYNDVNKKEE